MYRLTLACVAVLNAICLAGVWSLLSLQGLNHAWLGPPLAFVLVLLLHLQGLSRGQPRAALALALYVLAAAYAAYLEASGRIAAELGLTLLEGLRRIGLEMAWAWYRAHSDGVDHLLLLAGAGVAWLLGLLLGTRAPRRR